MFGNEAWTGSLASPVPRPEENYAYVPLVNPLEVWLQAQGGDYRTYPLGAEDIATMRRRIEKPDGRGEGHKGIRRVAWRVAIRLSDIPRYTRSQRDNLKEIWKVSTTKNLKRDTISGHKPLKLLDTFLHRTNMHQVADALGGVPSLPASRPRGDT